MIKLCKTRSAPSPFVRGKFRGGLLAVIRYRSDHLRTDPKLDTIGLERVEQGYPVQIG